MFGSLLQNTLNKEHLKLVSLHRTWWRKHILTRPYYKSLLYVRLWWVWLHKIEDKCSLLTCQTIIFPKSLARMEPLAQMFLFQNSSWKSLFFFGKILRGVFGIIKSSMGLLFSCFITCLYEDIKPIIKHKTFFFNENIFSWTIDEEIKICFWQNSTEEKNILYLWSKKRDVR